MLGNCHLLALPRELRNNIYSYLQDPAYLDPDLISGSSQLNTPDYTLICRFEVFNLPYLNVLLTHPQIYTEYKESPCFTDLSIHLTYNLYSDNTPPKPLPPSSHARCIDGTLFFEKAEPRHVTALVNLENWSQRCLPKHLVINWPGRSHQPLLKTWRMFQRVRRDCLVDADVLPLRPQHRIGTHQRKSSFLPRVQQSMFGLKMVQRGEGLQFGQSERAPYQMSALDGRRLARHDVHKIGVYMYAMDEKAHAQFWTKDEVLGVDDELGPQVGYGGEALEIMAPEIGDLCGKLPGVLSEWYEACGLEQVARWMAR